MTTGSTTTAQSLQDRTPADRDRVIDFVRGLSILVVVLGHWTMAAVTQAPDGLRLGNVLSVSPALHPATWLLQVMPLFFVAAGFTTALALGRSGRSVTRFVAGRLERVLLPTLAFVAVWIPLAWLLPRLGVSGSLVSVASTNAAMVLWFLAVYVLLALVAPVQFAVHRRWPWLLVVALPLVALLLDRTQGTGLAALGFVNYLVVFAFCAELGHLYAAGRLSALPRQAWVGAVAGSGALLVLATGPGPYPVSMIGLPGQEISNMMPPSVCVVLVAVLQMSLVMLARPGLQRWLARPGPWLATVVVNRSIMTIFLWHLTAFVATAALLLWLGLPLPPPGSVAWWLHKVLWLVVAGALTALLVWVFSPVERLPGRASTQPGRLALLGGLAAVAGLTMVACAGFTHVLERGGVELAGLTFASGPGAALVLLAWVLARWPAAQTMPGAARQA